MWPYFAATLFVVLLVGLFAVRVVGVSKRAIRNVLARFEHEFRVDVWTKPVSVRFGASAHIPGITPNTILYLVPEEGEGGDGNILIFIYHYVVRERNGARVERMRLQIVTGDPERPETIEITYNKKRDRVIACTGYDGRVPELERAAAFELVSKISTWVHFARR